MIIMKNQGTIAATTLARGTTRYLLDLNQIFTDLYSEKKEHQQEMKKISNEIKRM